MVDVQKGRKRHTRHSMIFSTALTGRSRVLRQAKVQAPYHTLMQQLKMLSIVPLQKKDIMGLGALLNLYCVVIQSYLENVEAWASS